MMGYEGNIEATRLPMLFGSGIGILAGVLSFIMPSTPPKKTGTKITFGDIIGIKALRLFKDRNFCVFALCSFLIVLPGLFYWNWCNFYLNEIHWPAVQFKQSIGQMAETVFLFIMPFFFARLGVKMMLLIGMLAWVVRFACFGYGDTDALVFLLYTGLALHGVCFDFFFVTGQLYTDAKAPKEVQASAQGLITLMTFGLGWWGGSNLSGWIIGKYVTKTEVVDGVTKVLAHDWRAIWHYPLIMAAVITVIFVALFNDKLVVGRAKPGELS
jgi:nucleoside transporter